MSKDISRKDFLKNLGLATLSVPGLSTFTTTGHPHPLDNNRKKLNTNKKRPDWHTRRGSWVRKEEASDGDITLVKNRKACPVVIEEKENSAVYQAAKFLAEDIKKISGSKPAITNNISANQACIRIATIGISNIPQNVDISDIKGNWEAFKIITKGDIVWLIGADFRGTAFAVYTLSERLGIDPLYIWTGYKPLKTKKLVLKNTDYTSASPTFKYRGFFHDDEDILPRPFEWSGYPLRVGDIDILWYQKYFETALRLKMNMVAPYTRVHRRYEVQQCAGEWGLIYTSHHYDILLSNPFGIVRFGLAEKRNVSPDWDWFKNKEDMIKFWRGGVWENKDLDCIWPVGLRGTNDYGYAFPKGMSEADQTKVFNDVIDIQVKSAKDILACKEPPVYTFTLWSEMIKKYEDDKSGFELPEDVIIVWSDNMDGGMDHLPKSTGKWKHGIYYHLAMYGGGVTKQGTHTVSPFKIAESFKDSINANATEYMLVNVSELRDYVMETRFISDICWDASSVFKKEGSQTINPDAGKTFIDWWNNEYFGPYDVVEKQNIYKIYYELFDDPNKLWFAADLVAGLLDRLVKKFKGESYKPVSDKDWALLKSREKKYVTAMNLIEKCQDNMTPEQQQYFFENAQLGLYFDWRPTQSALLLYRALKENNKEKAWEYIHEAMKPLEQLELEILKAERPPFDKWYRETWIRGTLTPLNVHRSYLLMRAFIASEGKTSRPPKRNGHDNLEQSKIWNDFLEASEKLNDPLSRE